MNNTLWFWGGVALLFLNSFLAAVNIATSSYYLLPVSALGIVASILIIYNSWKRL